MKYNTHAVWISFLILSLLCINCRRPDVPASVAVISKNDRATGIIIRGLQIEEPDLSKRVEIQLIHPGERSAVLGQFKLIKDEVIFEPLVPFTSGLQYEVLLDDSLFASIEIPKNSAAPPELLSIYPTQDTLPENLLKVYLHFSQPMVESRSLPYLTLIKNDRDTLKGTFLDLQPELWNAEGTILTLWLDPGRIKRDLIPNRQLGIPLNNGSTYTLYVSSSWKSKNGNTLSQEYSKTFFTTDRDDASPRPANWKILSPMAGTKQPLELQFPESLDFYILNEGVKLVDKSGDFVSGTIALSNEERTLKFFPDNPWSAGDFALQIEARLEDLAGNNLNRPFDRNVNDKIEEEKKIFTREIKIR